MSPRRKKGPLEKGQELYLRGRYHEALEQYLQAMVQDPDDAQVHCGMGEVLEALGRPGEALVAFDQALRLNPDLAWAHFGRGGILQGLRRYEEAAAAYRRAAEQEPTEAAFPRALGVVLYLCDDLEGSLAAYRQALQSDPGDALSLYGLGLDLDALGRVEEAIVAYQQAATADPADPWPHLRLAGLLARHHHPKAGDHLRQAAALLGKDAAAQAVHAMLEGRPQAALDWLRQAVARLPESADWLARDPDLEALQADERFWLILSAGRRL